ncbi:murein hydrolase activator EnvC family protein [Caldithrix abyssi]
MRFRLAISCKFNSIARVYFIFWLIFGFIHFNLSVLHAQVGIDGSLNKNRNLLKELESQIDELRQKILATQKKKSSLATQIQLLEHEMALISRSRGILEQEIRLLQSRISESENKLRETNQQLEDLQTLYAARAVYAYKYGRIKNIELLLSSRSLNQAMVRLKHLRQIARHDENLIRTIRNKKKQIEQIKRSLEKSLQQKDIALKSLEEKTRQFVARKKEKQRLLSRIKRNQANYQQLLTRKNRERASLLDLIAALEKERLKQEKQTPDRASKRKPGVVFKFKNFEKARGKLPWPVKGKVISHFGKKRDPVLKTYVKNTDIEIKAKPGSPVRCVFPGVVRVIQYLPGYGNLVIVDHGKGYYSVYSHLAEIYVYWDSPVEQNQIIGKVSDSGYNGSPSLGFGIYSHNKIHNPEHWLE